MRKIDKNIILTDISSFFSQKLRRSPKTVFRFFFERPEYFLIIYFSELNYDDKITSYF